MYTQQTDNMLMIADGKDNGIAWWAAGSLSLRLTLTFFTFGYLPYEVHESITNKRDVLRKQC